MTTSDRRQTEELQLSDYQQRTAQRAIRDVLDGHLSIYTNSDGNVTFDRVVMMDEGVLIAYLEHVGIVQRPVSAGRWPVNFAWTPS